MNARGYPNAHLSQKKAEMALTMLLYGCSKERLKRLTAGELLACYHVPFLRIEALLADARLRRGQ